MGDLRYGDYVPNNIKPIDLSREFLIAIRIGYIWYIMIFVNLNFIEFSFLKIIPNPSLFSVENLK